MAAPISILVFTPAETARSLRGMRSALLADLGRPRAGCCRAYGARVRQLALVGRQLARLESSR